MFLYTLYIFILTLTFLTLIVLELIIVKLEIVKRILDFCIPVLIVFSITINSLIKYKPFALLDITLYHNGSIVFLFVI